MWPVSAVSGVRDQLSEPGNSTNFYSESELLRYYWYAEDELNNVLGCVRATTAFTTTTNTKEYDTPTSFVRVERVTWDNAALKRIDLTELEALDQRGYSGTYSTGNPSHYYIYADKIGFWPIPDSSATVNMWGVKEPTEITSASSGFSVPREFEKRLDDYVLYRCYLKDDITSKADAHLKLWEKAKEQARYDWQRRKYSGAYPMPRDQRSYATTDLGLI